MRLVSAILAAAAAAVMAADPGASTADAGLEEQLLRFEAMTAKQGLSVFKYPHLAPAAASLASLPENIASPVKAMLTTCGPDVEQLCQVTFGASIPSDKARGTAMLTALTCLHDRFPQVSTACVHAAHTAAESIATGGFEAQQEVLATKADAALRSAAAACDAATVQAACPGTTSSPPTTPKQQPGGAPKGGKPGRDPGMRPNQPGWRLLRWGSHSWHHAPPPPSEEPLPPPPAAKAWFLAHTQASPEDVQALGTSVEDAAACALALAGPPPAAASWMPWHHPHAPQPPTDTGDACVDSTRTWLATAAHGSRSASLAEAASHEGASIVSARSAAPLSGPMRPEDWAVPGMQGDHGAPSPGGPPPDHPRHHWRHFDDDDDEHDDDVGDILFSLLMLVLVSACILRCACRARRRRCRRNRDEPHPFEQREAHQSSVPTPQEAAAAAAVAASAPSSSAPQYFYGASAAPPPPAAQTVQQGMYPDVPPAPSRWSLASVINMGGGPGAGYAPVRTMEH